LFLTNVVSGLNVRLCGWAGVCYNKELGFTTFLEAGNDNGNEVRTLRQRAAIWKRGQPREQYAAAPVESEFEARARCGGRFTEASARMHCLHSGRQSKESRLSLHYWTHLY
jgi:hypothetical protein